LFDRVATNEKDNQWKNQVVVGINILMGEKTRKWNQTLNRGKGKKSGKPKRHGKRSTFFETERHPGEKAGRRKKRNPQKKQGRRKTKTTTSKSSRTPQKWGVYADTMGAKIEKVKKGEDLRNESATTPTR